MCGFCLEGSVLRDIGDALIERVELPSDPHSFIVLLQEVRDWRNLFLTFGGDRTVQAELVVLCRQWSERLFSSAKRSSAVGSASVELKELPAWLNALDYRLEWQWVLQIDAALPEHFSIDEARTELDAYIGKCLRPSEAGDAGWGADVLRERFLVLSVSFDLLAARAPDDSRIPLLATTSPEREPPFDGFDLWLQRRALRFCVARYGISFLATNMNELRVETIYSVIISELVSCGDLKEIKMSLKDYTQLPMNLTIDDLYEVIDAKVDILSKGS